MKKRIFFFDIDGTLYSENKKNILSQTKKLILTLSKKPNTILSIATGRNYRNLNVLEELFPLFKYFVLCNGAITIENKSSFKQNQYKLIDKNPISSKHIQYLFEQIIDNDFNIIPYNIGFNKEAFFSNGNSKNLKFIEEWRKNHWQNGIEIEDSQIDNTFHFNNEVYTIYMFGDDRLKINLKNTEEKNIFNIYNWKNHMDLTVKNINKFHGIQKIKNKFNDYEVVCMGDGCNDEEMLQYSDLSIAMGNSKYQYIKEMSDLVTPHVDENKIYDFFEQHHLI
ncbi:HAD family hydrolase [Candidatus Phytoplasma phoenicium]|uniref:HAD family hydrolase n=1 Tax=Candidatus Phytoplasma phoenicium TaxID=198422 RepID=A0A2S8NV53_9MOLU|nr:HAD family hydrolase [Candidatus Phytoplasma phoenicium]